MQALQENISLTLISRSIRLSAFLSSNGTFELLVLKFHFVCFVSCCGFKTYPHLDAKQRKTKKWPYSCLPSPARLENDFEKKLKVKVERQFSCL